jgi:hypothetical protein
MMGISRRWLVLVTLVPILLVGVAVTQQSPAIDAGAKLRSIRSRVPFISMRDFLYRHPPRDTTRDEEQVAAAFRVLMELESSKLRVADLVGLAGHSEPDIRALALLGLVARESREVIPACIQLVNDNADTLPLQEDRRSMRPRDARDARDARVATEPQKVGHIARFVLGKFYRRMA